MGNIVEEKELHETAGIVPRFCFDLFRRIESVKKKNAEAIQVQISYFEIYKEKIQDLLSPAKASLRIREHPQHGPYVVDLSHHAVSSFEEIQRWLLVGNRQRATAATSSNERSSRSHAIFTITLAQSHEEKVDGQSHEIRRQSRINFIDLAGSERVASVNSIGERREEGLNINQSLLTLGRVITALAEQTFVPYRESVLTWLLKESLGGDSKTVMLATISPYAAHVEETLSTLRYACQARSIINTARISEDPNGRLIRHLREQIKLLEKRTQQDTDVRVSVETVVSSSDERVGQLEQEIHSLKERLVEAVRLQDESWQDKVAQAEHKRQLAEQMLFNYGLSTHKDPNQPCLVNVNQDPQLSGTLFFALKTGANWVGSTVCSADCANIQLEGFMIEEKHCRIENVDGALTLSALAETYVNGQLVTSPVSLSHGDRVIIGGSHYFHLHHPKSASNSQKKVPDYLTAYEELRRFQEERLEAAIREAQEQTRCQLLTEMEELRTEAALEMSLQKHSYEDEIATLNRVIEERNSQEEVDSPPPPMVPSKSLIWDDIELLLQDTQRKLELTPDTSTESSFMIQSMISEANAICRRLSAPYLFSRKDALEDGLKSAICVHDQNQHLFIKWSVEKMRQKLKILREEAEESLRFPSDRIFDDGDVWQVEDEMLTLIAPSIRDKLEKLQKRHECSFSGFLDDSRFSMDSSMRRNSLLPRSSCSDSSSIAADCCRTLISQTVLGNMFYTACRMCSVVGHHLAQPERTASFTIGLTVHAHTAISMLPGVVEQTLSKRELPPTFGLSWLDTAVALGQKLQNAVDYIMQGTQLESKGLSNEWIQRALESNNAILSLLCELTTVFYSELPPMSHVPLPIALSGFLSAQSKMHDSIIHLAETVRGKMAQLPEEESSSSLSVSQLSDSCNFNTGWLVKACHDSVTQVQILLERYARCRVDDNISADDDLCSMHLKFHRRVDSLLRIGHSVECLFSQLQCADLAQIKASATALEAQSKLYVQRMENVEEGFIGDLSFAVSMVLKIVAERKRMTLLRRGRDITYSPLPAQLLASTSTSRKRNSSFDDASESYSSIESVNSNDHFHHGHSQSASEDEDDDVDDFNSDVSISPSVIQRALQFQTPVKSSLKSANNIFSKLRNVRFDVTDSASLSSSPV